MNKADRTKARSQIKDLEQLKAYLYDNLGDELPFNEDCWQNAVKKAQENKLENKYPLDKNVKRKIEEPIPMYFKLISLDKYRRESEKELSKLRKSDEFKIKQIKFDLPEGVDQDDSIVKFIMSLPDTEESEFLMQRFLSYYDTYEINEGADKYAMHRMLSLELEAHRIDMARSRGEYVNLADEEKITKQSISLQESLKWTKKQRSSLDDMSQNKFALQQAKWEKEDGVNYEIFEYPKDEIDRLLEIIAQNRELIFR